MENDLKKVLADIVLHAVMQPESPDFEIVRRSVLDKARMMLDHEDLKDAAERERQRFLKEVW